MTMYYSKNQAKQLYLQQALAAQHQAMYQGTAATTAAGGVAWWVSGTTATSTVSTLGNSVMNSLYASQGTMAAQVWPGDSALVRDTLRLMGECAIADGEPCVVRLPDGAHLEVKADGSYIINDANAKVIYRANRVRDFNSFINASDKLEGFIKYCGAQGVRQDEMLDLPIKLFIGWLILQAAMADGENPDPSRLLEDVSGHIKSRCRCGRFIARKLTARRIAFCRPVCLERELAA